MGSDGLQQQSLFPKENENSPVVPETRIPLAKDPEFQRMVDELLAEPEEGDGKTKGAGRSRSPFKPR